MQQVYQFLSSRGIYPKMHIMGNGCPQIVKDCIKNDQNMDLILVLPHDHRANTAEKAIESSKCHFISGLATLNPDLPMRLLYRLHPLACVTINLLRPSRVNPKFSAEEFLNGVFDCNKTTISLLGCKVSVYETPCQRNTWSPRTQDGWHIDTDPNLYRHHKVHIPKTRA